MFNLFNCFYSLSRFCSDFCDMLICTFDANFIKLFRISYFVVEWTRYFGGMKQLCRIIQSALHRIMFISCTPFPLLNRSYIFTLCKFTVSILVLSKVQQWVNIIAQNARRLYFTRGGQLILADVFYDVATNTQCHLFVVPCLNCSSVIAIIH